MLTVEVEQIIIILSFVIQYCFLKGKMY